MHFHLQMIDRETGHKLGGAKPIVARDQAHAEEMAVERVLDYKHHVELLDISRKPLAKLLYQGPLFGAEKEKNPRNSREDLTEDQRWLLNHINMWGSDGYPIQKLGRGWNWGPVRSIKGPPVVFRTRKEAVASFESYIDYLTDVVAGMRNPPPHYDSTIGPYEAGRLLGEYQKGSPIAPSFDSIVAHYRRWQKAVGLKPTHTRPHTASVLIPRLQSEPQWKDFTEGYAAGRPSARRENPADDPHNLLEQDRSLRVGQEVLARWGYGGGFRAQGRGVITKLYEKSVRVKLLEDVMFGDKIGWHAGFVLKGIPRFGTREWVPENSVAPLAAAELQGAA